MALRGFRSCYSLEALSSICLQTFYSSSSSSSRAGLAAARHFSSSSLLPGSNPLGSGGERSSIISGLRFQWPPSRHMIARWRSWETLADCKHWLIVLDFPKDPRPTREEMISTYVNTLANVLGSIDEAKKKIYALSTTVYTGFQCKIDEATSEKLKDQPLVSWVLPDGYGDPENGIFAGDRYDNGVITPDPRPPRPVNERSRNFDRQRSYDRPRYDGDVRPRDFRPMEGRDNVQENRQDYSPREGENIQGERQQYRSMTGSQTTQEYGRDYRPVEGRESLRGRDDYTSREARNPLQGNQKV